MKSVQLKKATYSGPIAAFEQGKVSIVVLGTAHVSPDIRDKKIGLLFSSLVLSAYQKKLGAERGVKPGQEMITAVHLAEAQGRTLVLADRPVSTTLTRAWRKVSFFSKYNIVSQLFASLLFREDVAEADLEKLKSEDALADMFKSLPPRYKSIKDVFIGERDRYLAEKIREAASALKKGTVFAVVGAGHVPGIRTVLETDQEVNIKELDEVPPTSPVKTVLTWIFFSTIIGAAVYWLSNKGADERQQALVAWVLGRSLGSGIGAILAFAHPLTVLVTMIMAPISIFIPGSRLWMFSALTQVWRRKPHVQDFEDMAFVSDSTKTFVTALYNNRVLHLFWTIALVSIGLTIGNGFIVAFIAKNF
ncbi:MAG: TraB family protein [Spirochaetia bacterium]|nr:TraB family protein [Spirochaetia bacterium]